MILSDVFFFAMLYGFLSVEVTQYSHGPTPWRTETVPVATYCNRENDSTFAPRAAFTRRVKRGQEGTFLFCHVSEGKRPPLTSPIDTQGGARTSHRWCGRPDYAGQSCALGLPTPPRGDGGAGGRRWHCPRGCPCPGRRGDGAGGRGARRARRASRRARACRSQRGPRACQGGPG